MVRKRKGAKFKEKQKGGKAVYVALVVIIIGAIVVFSNIKGKGDNDTSSGYDYGLNYTYTHLALPEYAYKSAKTERAYKIVVEIPEIIDKVKCYCACGQIRSEQFPQGHQSLKNCYLDDNGGFTDHAIYCDLCMHEAIDVYEMYQNNVSIDEISARIDEKYGR